MDGEAPQGVCVVKVVRRAIFAFAPVCLSALLANGAQPQASQALPEALPSSIAMPAIPVPDASAPFADFSKSWPARMPLGKEGVLAVAIERPRVSWGFSHLVFDLVAREADKEEASAVLSAAGIEFTSDVIEQAVAFEAGGSFVARFTENARKGMAKRTLGSDHFVVATLTPASVNAKVPSIERTGFALYSPITPKGSTPRPARGVAVVMPGIFGTPEGTLESLVASLRRDGWHVLRMLAQPSRFTQAVSWKIDPAASDGEIDALGKEVAGTLTNRAAECAYAAEGALRYVNMLHPELAELPRIAIGFSGGAISLPTVVAREPAKYKAAVLVGGACHYWLTNAHSTYADMIRAIRVEWVTPPTLDQRRRVAEAYLRHAPLDAFHTAAALHGTPTLVIQANADSAVASVLGDVLWERLGKPDRWIRPGEHLPLFISLIKDLPAINDWINAKVAAPTPVSATP